MKNKILLIVPALFSLPLVGCGGGNEKNDPPQVETKLEFKDVYFDDLTYTYTGESYILNEVRGAPADTKITYAGREAHIDAGSYKASATLEKDGYKTITLNATLLINPAKITGLSLEGKTVKYDGREHINDLNIVGSLPEGANKVQVVKDLKGNVVTSAINAGSYNYEISISKKNYETLVLNSTLNITKAEFAGVEFKDVSYEYDGNPHSIEITGTLPGDSIVTYSSDVSGMTNSATEVGEYNVTARITNPNFETLVLTAKLTITTVEYERYVKATSSGVYFQNALHYDYLYYLYKDGSGKYSINKISNDNAIDMISYNTNDVMYVSRSLIAPSIKTANFDKVNNKANINTIFVDNARYIQYESESIVYYVYNGLTKEKSGIFKVDYSAEEPVITKLSTGKAKYLTRVNDKLYFADGNNGYKLSSISTSGEEQIRRLVVDEKINNLYENGGALYYTVNNLAGNYIEKYTNEKGRRKLTSDAGIDFTFINGELYYINVDKLNTAIWGKGIYKVNTSPLFDNSIPGTKVIEVEKGVCSLTSDGSNLIYYDMNQYELISSSISGTNRVNMLEGFVKPEDPTPTSFGGGIETYNDVIYYLDIWDEKTLHSYNPKTKMNVRLTSSKVDNFSIIGDEIYMNMVTTFVNNDTYRFNLKTGGKPEKINTKDGIDFVTCGDYLYYAENNASGVRTAIRRQNLKTLEDERIYDKGVSNLRIIDNKLYFIDGYQIFGMNLNYLVTEEVKPNNKSVHTTVFDTDGKNIYYRDMHGVGYALKRLSSYNLSTKETKILAQEKTDPISIMYHNGEVYYYTDTTSAENNGLYKVKANVASTSKGKCVLACNSTYYATTFNFLGDDIYFLNYIMAGLFGDSHIYKTTINGDKPIKIA